MNFLPTFSAWQFAVAGLACAAAPIIIHLLNRRRYKVVHWAAMPFLREALQRNRKMMQLRDLLVLLLRTAAVLFFGLALARPFFSSGSQEFDRSQPLHAILIFDNSLSMGYTMVEGTLLDRAKDRAKAFIEELPAGSVVTIVPLSGTAAAISADPYRYKDKALTEAIDALEVVDRSASVQLAANEAREAMEAAPDLAKRIVFFSDQQAENWRDMLAGEQFKQLPSMQVVDVGPQEWENAWVADLHVQDGLADVETPATFVVKIEHLGTETAGKDLQVQFFVGEDLVSEKMVALSAREGTTEVTFEHTFSTILPAEGQPEYVPVKAVISADSLMADNERHLVVPVVASLPVLFIDQYDDDEENPQLQRIGETRHLRSLLAPTSSRNELQRQLIRVKHLTIDQLTQGDLEEARLVVIAGIESPGSEQTVSMLRDYVRQGGQLVIGAGGAFDHQQWNELAWADGRGILPAPFDGEPIGQLPNEAALQLNPVSLSYDSMGSHYYFQLGGTDRRQLVDLYSDPLFFRYVPVRFDADVLAKVKEAERERLEEEYEVVLAAEQLRQESSAQEASGELSEEARRKEQEIASRLLEFQPAWLRWQSPAPVTVPTDAAAREEQILAKANDALPQVRARFSSQNGAPYLVEREIGRGNVLLVASGLSSSWNTLPLTDTFFVFDRMLRSMIQSTLPNRNFLPSERLTIPLPSDDREVEISLVRPGLEDDPEPIDSNFINREQRGVTVNQPLTRGLYHVTAEKRAISAGDKAATEVVWDLAFAINGPEAESDMTPVAREKFEEQAADSQVRWVGPGETISLAGAQIRGQNSWKYLILLVLLFLLLELAVLAWPAVKAQLEERRAAPQN